MVPLCTFLEKSHVQDGCQVARVAQSLDLLKAPPSPQDSKSKQPNPIQPIDLVPALLGVRPCSVQLSLALGLRPRSPCLGNPPTSTRPGPATNRSIEDEVLVSLGELWGPVD